MTTSEAWRLRAEAMIGRLRPDLDDEDWRGAMTVLAAIAKLTRRSGALRIALAARGAGRDAMAGLALRRSAQAQLAAAFAAVPQREAA